MANVNPKALIEKLNQASHRKLMEAAALCSSRTHSSRHAPNSLRRNAAALPNIRIPSTTMIAVDNCVPTPS